MSRYVDPTYRSWCLMRSRCQNPNSTQYPYYGGRGIAVCGRWNIFQHFFEDMGERPVGTTLDRIDADDDYRPGNVRWATRAEQRRNRRDFVGLTAGGRTQAIVDWARERGMRRQMIEKRLQRGWTPEEAVGLTPRALKMRRSITLDGETLSLSEWARRRGLEVKTLSARLRYGWSPAKALGFTERGRIKTNAR